MRANPNGMRIGVGVLRPEPMQALRVWYRHALAYLRFYKSSILLNFFEPIVGLVALGIGLGRYVHLANGLSFLQFIAPGMVCVTAMNATSFDTLFSTYNFLHENRVYPSMITSPLTVDDLICGTLAWQATRAMLYGGTFLVVIAAFGLVHSFWSLLALPVLALAGVMFSAPALSMSALARAFEHLFYYITLVITPMYMFSGIFFPTTRLPQWVQDFIWLTPLYHTAHLVRGLVLGDVSLSLLADAGWMVAFTFIALLFPAALIRRKLLV